VNLKNRSVVAPDHFINPQIKGGRDSRKFLSTACARMRSTEPSERESVHVAPTCRTADKGPFADGKFPLLFWRVFFNIHA